MATDIASKEKKGGGEQWKLKSLHITRRTHTKREEEKEKDTNKIQNSIINIYNLQNIIQTWLSTKLGQMPFILITKMTCPKGQYEYVVQFRIRSS